MRGHVIKRSCLLTSVAATSGFDCIDESLRIVLISKRKKDLGRLVYSLTSFLIQHNLLLLLTSKREYEPGVGKIYSQTRAILFPEPL